MWGNIPSEEQEVEVSNLSEAMELSGKLSKQFKEDKLMNSVLQNDKEKIEEGKLLRESINQGIGAFTPDLMLEQFVNNYSLAENLYGETILSLLSGYDENYLKKNIRIPEFQKELKKRITEKIDKLKEENLVDKDSFISEKGVELAALVLAMEELDNITAKGLFGEKFHKKANIYGSKQDVKMFKKGDRYRDIAVKSSARTAIRRGHTKISVNDLKSFEKESKGQVNIVYAVDASGSMKGNKIDMCKKAGVALAFKAIEEKDKVGLIVFGSDIKESIRPTYDFAMLSKAIAKARASRETDLALTIKHSIELFPSIETSKHLMLLTDALPTKGTDPEKETLKAVEIAANNDITISVVGINIDKNGEKLAKKIVQIGKGKLYLVKNLEELDKIVLEDYYGVM